MSTVNAKNRKLKTGSATLKGKVPAGSHTKEPKAVRISLARLVFGSVSVIIIFLIVQILSLLIIDLLEGAGLPAFICNMLGAVLYALGTWFYLKLYASEVFKMTMDELGMARRYVESRWIIIAVVLSAAVTLIALFMSGEWMRNDEIAPLAALSYGVLFAGIAGGFVEEIVFRGFVYNLFKARWNQWVAIFAPSFFYGAVHTLGMDFSVPKVMQVWITGMLGWIMYSVIASRSGSVWISGTVHAVWNIVIGGGILYIGETVNTASLFNYVLKSDTFLFTGGEFGIEASLLSACGYAVVTILVLYAYRKKGRAKKI